MSLWAATRSRRTAAVALQSFASGLPLGLVWYAIPDWMRDIGVDIQVVGLLTLAQAPWTFKVLWAPLVDRFTPPFWGRRRGWMAVTQVALAALGLLLAGVGERPEAVWVVGALALAIAIASATQDIAIDAYAVEVLRPDEQGAAAGARTALYRAALLVSGGVSISLAARIGWPAVNVLLACAYLPMLVLTWRSPEPDVPVQPPRTLRDAVWQPILGLLTRPRALEILAFVLLYKFSDQLTQSLTRPFLVDMGYGADERGLALATISIAGFVAGSLVGGWATTLAGLGRSLWVFGVLQLVSNLGYYALAVLDGPSHRRCTQPPGSRARIGHGQRCVLGAAAPADREAVLGDAVCAALQPVRAAPRGGRPDHRLCGRRRRLARVLPGGDHRGRAGTADAARFVPLGVREPDLEPRARIAPGTGRVPAVGFLAAMALAAVAVLVLAAIDALGSNQTVPGIAVAFREALWRLLAPADATGWVSLGGVAAFAIVGGMLFAASRVRPCGSLTSSNDSGQA